MDLNNRLVRFDSLPLAALIARARLSRSLSLNDVATLVKKVAQEEDRNSGATRQTVHSWEQGVIPRPDSLRWLSKALGLPVDAVVHAAAAQEAMVTRRQVLRGAVVVGGGILSLTTGQSDSLERLNRALAGGSAVDGVTLDYLDRRVGAYWEDYHVGRVPAPLLLSYALQDFERVISLLERSLLPSTRVRLSALAGRAATVIGALHWDIGAYPKARDYVQTAITAAREGREYSVEMVAWAWSSLGWMYDYANPDCLRAALHSTQAARQLRQPEDTVAAWLAAIEAEVHANLGNRSQCMAALRDASKAPSLTSSGDGWTWSRFDEAGLAGFQGVCLLRLGRAAEARAPLEEALALAQPGERQRRTILLIDLGQACAMAGMVDEACSHAREAIRLTVEVGSTAKSERLHPLRRELAARRDTPCVKSFHEELASDPSLRDYVNE